MLLLLSHLLTNLEEMKKKYLNVMVGTTILYFVCVCICNCFGYSITFCFPIDP